MLRIERLRKLKGRVDPKTAKVLKTLKGDRGEPGQTGEKGDVGDQGIQGERGIQGLPGDRGLAGKTGMRGERGEKGETGDPGLVWKSDWKTGVNYSEYDVVAHMGSSYVIERAHKSTRDSEPGSGTTWRLYYAVLASKGEKGSPGAPGLSTTVAVNGGDSDPGESGFTQPQILSFISMGV